MKDTAIGGVENDDKILVITFYCALYTYIA